MLKHYFFFLSVLFLGATTSLSAQITLTADNYGVQDSVILRDTLYFEGGFVAEIPTGGENQVWDYSNVQPDSLFVLNFQPVPEEDTCFVGAQTQGPLTFFFQAFRYPGVRYTAYQEDGRFNVGRKTEGAKFPLTAITGSPMDTLNILPRTIRGKETLIPFPATFGTIAQDSFVQAAPFELSVAAFGLNRTPAAQTFTTKKTVEVIGYGDLILPALSGVPSEPLEALLVRETTVEVANYTLAGGPAPAMLLQAFGVSQNETTTDVDYYFHVKGMGRSAARLLPTAGSTDYRFQFRRVPPGTTTSVGNVNKPAPLSFFPNPVRPGEIIQLTTPTGISGGMVRLLDLQGRIISENAFATFPGDRVGFRVPAAVKPGLYFQQVVDQGGRLVGVGKVVVR